MGDSEPGRLDAEAQEEAFWRRLKSIARTSVEACCRKTRWGGDLHVIEDLASEVILRAIRRLSSTPSVRHDARLPGLLFSMARGIVTDHVRKAGRRVRAESREPGGASEPLSTEKDPMESAHDASVKERLSATLLRLDKKERRILEQVIVEHRSRRSVGKEMGIKANALGRILKRALRVLKKHVGTE